MPKNKTKATGGEKESPDVIPDIEELRPYVGQWLVLDGQAKVRASAPSMDEAVSRADGLGLVDPDFLYVPTGPFIG